MKPQEITDMFSARLEDVIAHMILVENLSNALDDLSKDMDVDITSEWRALHLLLYDQLYHEYIQIYKLSHMKTKHFLQLADNYATMLPEKAQAHIDALRERFAKQEKFLEDWGEN